MSSIISKNEQSKKHRVFISFHKDDEKYRNEFNLRWGQDFLSTYFRLDPEDFETSEEYKIRLAEIPHIVESNVVVALYGAKTKERKHIDWEISAGLNGEIGKRKGLVVLILPEFPVSPKDENGNWNRILLYPHLHPRTAKNLEAGYADLYFWPGMYKELPEVLVKDMIEIAAKKQDTHNHIIQLWPEQYINGFYNYGNLTPFS